MATGKRTARPGASGRAAARLAANAAPASWRKLAAMAFCGVLMTAAALALLSPLALDWRLRQGPIPAQFLIGRIEAAIDEQIGPFSVKIATASLRYDDARDNKFGVLLGNVAVTARDGGQIAVIASAAVDIDWPGLFSASVLPTGLTLIEPKIRVRYARDAGLMVEPETAPAGQTDIAVPVPVPASRRQASAPSPSPAPSPAPAQTPPGVAAVPAASASPAWQSAASRVTALGLLRGLLDGTNTAASRLKSLSVRNANVTFGDTGHQTSWRVPQFDIHIESSGKGQALVGSGRAIAPSGALEAKLRAELPAGSSGLRLSAVVDHFVPADLAGLSPALLPLAPAFMPVGGDAALTFEPDGGLSQMDMNVGLGKGHYDVGGACSDSLRLDQGLLHVRYVRGTGKVELLPSPLAANGSAATVSGLALVSKDASGRDRWQYTLALDDARVADTAHGLAAVPIDSWSARGTFTPSSGETVLDRLALQAGEAHLAMAGRIAQTGLDFEAQLDNASAGLVLRLWPACFQVYARNWVLANVHSGLLSKGHMHVALDAAGLEQLRAGSDVPSEAATAQFAVDDINFSYADGLPPVIATHGNIQFAGRRFIADIPDAASQMPSGHVLTLTRSRFEIPDFLDPSPRGKVTVTASGPIETGIEFLNAKPLNLVGSSGLRFTDLSGDFEGRADFELPVTRPLQPGDLTLKATAALSSLKFKHPVGGFTLQSGSIDLEATESSLRADGDIIVNGATAKIAWSRPLGKGSGPSPPIKLTATLDANDREQLGILVNHLIAGEVPVTVDLAAGPDDGSGRIAHVEADLSRTELVLDTLAWRKAEGEPATVTFDVLAGDKGRTRLADFRFVADRAAISGELELGSDHKLASFHFPNFSINVVTQLDVAGHVRADKVLEVSARGRYFDGRDFFHSLFTVGQITAKALPPPKATTGLDLTADIDTILGYSQLALHDVHLHVIRDYGVLTGLSGKGVLDGGRKVSVGLEHKPSQPRYLQVETDDAGRAFKLINLYQGVDGGSAALKVNLDGEGTAEKTGTLWAKNFTLLGDPVVKEVLNEAAAPGGAPKKNADRAEFEFDRMRVLFSVGQGQLVLRDMFINGPVLGATLRGRIDYGRQAVQLSGTYIPLYGLNSMFGALPIFGQILVGRSGEGLLGITFAVDGALAKPEVIVNPVSVVAPGIFRQIFELGPESASIEQRAGGAAMPAPVINGTPETAADIGEAFPPMAAEPPPTPPPSNRKPDAARPGGTPHS